MTLMLHKIAKEILPAKKYSRVFILTNKKTIKDKI